MIALATFVALTAILGAKFVLPTMRVVRLRKGLIAPFADYIVPTFALGVLCGGSALATVLDLLFHPDCGSGIAFIAGSIMMGV